jgi:hypothetical protein
MHLIIAILLIANTFDSTSSLLSNRLASGCLAYKCKRSCADLQSTPVPGDNGFRFIVDNLKNGDSYLPGKTYKG